ncbi:MAG: division/cell wall cluster transcriptional repressor MraZ [Bacteroidota bacterium]|nr:division/cell wall cluster transcriptional repressor MraZ [Bacteroidota bacterium]
MQFLGEYECKLDTKGRFILPTGLKKQVPQEAQDRFVVNRGFEKCLVMYPRNEWEQIAEEINKLNPYVKRNREFIRYFFRGATELTLDSASRLLLPKRLQEYAGINKDIVLFAHTNKVEIWAQELYDNVLGNEPEDFAGLAESVMGNGKE